jgi:hypothetical protein
MAGRQAGFFAVDARLRRLSDLGDQLEAYAEAVDFELFRPDEKGRAIIGHVDARDGPGRAA